MLHCYIYSTINKSSMSMSMSIFQLYGAKPLTG